MREYKALEIVTVNAELVGLNDDQARRRKSLLKGTKKKNEFVPLGTLTFKAGEKFWMKGGANKTNMSQIQDIKAVAEAMKAKAEETKAKK